MISSDSRSRYRIIAGLTLAFAVAACAKKSNPPAADSAAMAPPPAPSPSVSTMELGKHLATTKRVADTTSLFAPRDTLYLAVVTENPGASSTLSAKWTFQTGQLVDSTSQAVASASGSSASVTEFHVVKPSGWPAGKYTVEVRLNGQSVGSKQLEVKR